MRDNDKNIVLAIFDFDKTLFNTPLPTTENRELLSEKLGYTKSGWWGRKESLNNELFDIAPNPWTKTRYDSHTNNGDIKELLTGRISKLKDQVSDILLKECMEFDGYHLADGRTTLDFKLDKIMELVEKHQPTEVFFYDDRTEHIQSFRDIGDEIEDQYGIKFNLFHVSDNGAYELKYNEKLN